MNGDSSAATTATPSASRVVLNATPSFVLNNLSAVPHPGWPPSPPPSADAADPASSSAAATTTTCAAVSSVVPQVPASQCGTLLAYAHRGTVQFVCYTAGPPASSGGGGATTTTTSQGGGGGPGPQHQRATSGSASVSPRPSTHQQTQAQTQTQTQVQGVGGTGTGTSTSGVVTLLPVVADVPGGGSGTTNTRGSTSGREGVYCMQLVCVPHVALVHCTCGEIGVRKYILNLLII
ncbi:hypothetical protein Pelo_5447 [Pelomyxa schiedti]|nr:hypothetical protein Pelo_5447 [Pelomyxa schiedti]